MSGLWNTSMTNQAHIIQITTYTSTQVGMLTNRHDSVISQNTRVPCVTNTFPLNQLSVHQIRKLQLLGLRLLFWHKHWPSFSITENRQNRSLARKQFPENKGSILPSQSVTLHLHHSRDSTRWLMISALEHWGSDKRRTDKPAKVLKDTQTDYEKPTGG